MKPYGFLYGAAQTSVTAGTLCAIKSEIYRGGGIHAAEKMKKIQKGIDTINFMC
jgi:hypothetical protein